VSGQDYVNSWNENDFGITVEKMRRTEEAVALL
jgi:hypothetical protein